MGIFAALAFWGVVAIMAGAWEGGTALANMRREKRQWNAERAAHYPKAAW